MMLQSKCVILALSLVLLQTHSPAIAGDINPPPGPIGPTMKTLVEVEPRIAVQSLPGSATALHVISEPGSYYLAGNVTGVSGKNGIEVTAAHVTVDLNGFVLQGVPDSLTGVAPGTGTYLLLRNGHVTGWGTGGVFVGGDSEVRNVRSYGNQGAGFRTSIRTTITQCAAYANGGGGIIVEGGSSVVSRCITRDNGGDGIKVFGGNSVVRNCVSTGNSDGIDSDGGGHVIIGNVCTGNGNDGIHIGGSGSRVESNDCRGNQNGLHSVAGGHLIIRNSARGNTNADYVLAGGSTVGPIISSGEIGTNTNPHANVRY